MALRKISKQRLQSQGIDPIQCASPQAVVEWLGAIQAQDFKMAKWAIARRLSDAKDSDLEAAIAQGQIIRTHILRPTWHFVSSKDIHWMLDLTGPQIKKYLKKRHRDLGLTETHLKKSRSIFERELVGDTHLKRDTLYEKLQAAKLDIGENRGYHLLFWAELEGVLCSGATKDGKTTYALLEERVPRTESISEDEALAKLAGQYFRSHGPATLADFAWWSGLTMSKARRGLSAIEKQLEKLDLEGQDFWFTDFSTFAKSGVQLLPAYDEFLIGYKNKSLSLPFEAYRKKVHNVGVFRPFLVVDGFISGVWKLVIKKDVPQLQLDLFQALNKQQEVALGREVERLGDFLGVRIKFEI